MVGPLVFNITTDQCGVHLNLETKSVQLGVTGTRGTCSKGKDKRRKMVFILRGVVHLPLQMKFHAEASLVNSNQILNSFNQRCHSEGSSD